MRALNDHTAYCASKGALDQLTRVMALELGKYRIRVNSVNPTIVMTPMGKQAWADPAKGGPMKARIPLGCFADPHHVSQTVAYLLSEHAGMINGVLLPVDGGFLTT
jgi:NAD(P)-dependent dehydrogenase (short-subunit alcohol dehydrogenase family)